MIDLSIEGFEVLNEAGEALVIDEKLAAKIKVSLVKSKSTKLDILQGASNEKLILCVGSSVEGVHSWCM